MTIRALSGFSFEMMKTYREELESMPDFSFDEFLKITARQTDDGCLPAIHRAIYFNSNEKDSAFRNKGELESKLRQLGIDFNSYYLDSKYSPLERAEYERMHFFLNTLEHYFERDSILRRVDPISRIQEELDFLSTNASCAAKITDNIKDIRAIAEMAIKCMKEGVEVFRTAAYDDLLYLNVKEIGDILRERIEKSTISNREFGSYMKLLRKHQNDLKELISLKKEVSFLDRPLDVCKVSIEMDVKNKDEDLAPILAGLESHIQKINKAFNGCKITLTIERR